MGRDMSIFKKVYFTVTDEHVRLLQRANVGWEDCEFGAPAIDCKRPYGNSDVHRDMAEILGVLELDEDEDFNLSVEQERYLDKLHKETQTALQIFLVTGQMKPGRYWSHEYHDDWQLEG